MKDLSVAQRRRQACWWFARLREPDLSSAVLKRWKHWESEPENRQLFDEIVRLNELTHRLPSILRSNINDERLDNYDGTVSVREWLAGDRARPIRRQNRASIVALAVAAGLIIVIAGLYAALLPWHLPSQSSEHMTVLETGIAEHKTVTLSDGSHVALGARTAVTAELTAGARTLVLSRGEALFQVARDPSRPFRVIAGGGAITALGTTFNVRRREDDQVIVNVEEGSVEVAPLDREHVAAIRENRVMPADRALVRRLRSGQELAYDVHGRFDVVHPAVVAASGGWREGRLHYQSERLRNVIADVNRYARKPIALGDASVGELYYSGTVFERDIADWIVGLPRIYPNVEVVADPAGGAVVRSRAGTAPPR